jgi:tetratricopeptide (TPR) repeat protein
MKIVRHCAMVVFLVALGSALTWAADDPGAHPAYLHALSDLRDARAHLERFTGSDHLNDEEQHAIDEIDKAIGEIKRASIDDGKNLEDHPPVDTHLGHRGRYHRALELLDKAHNDIAREEDDHWARGLRNRALGHIDEAHRVVDHIINRWTGD